MIQKPADNTYPIHDLLKHRWSPRAFADQLVEPEKLLSLFEAVRWSASCYNEQPWRLIVATRDQPQAFEKLLLCLNDGNRAWAQYAAVLMLTVAGLLFEVNSSPNRHAWHDIGMAMQNLTVQASSMGLMVHHMAGIHPAKAREMYAIPETYEVVTAVAVGYQGEVDRLSERNQTKEAQERTRKPITEFVFGSAWGQTSSLVAGDK